MQIGLENLSKTYSYKNVRSHIIRDFSFVFEDGGQYAIVGPNGSGKSTLLEIIGKINSYDAGSVIYEEPKQIRVGFIFQNYRDALLPWFSVEKNVLWPLKNIKVDSNLNNRINHILSYLNSRVPLGRKVALLSGGQAQLVSIARAWAFKANIVLADEPFSAIDLVTRRSLSKLLVEICLEDKATSIVVSHNIEEALNVANKVLVVDGPPLRIVEMVSIEEELPRKNKFYSSSSVLNAFNKINRALERKN